MRPGRQGRRINSHLALLLLLGGCTASWSRMVRYSTQPEPAGEPVVEGLYTSVIRGLIGKGEDPRLVIEPIGEGLLSPAAMTRGASRTIPRHWADTLKREVAVVLSDTSLDHDADHELIEAIAIRLRLTPVQVDRTPIPVNSKVKPVAHLGISGAGFNADSTLAAVHATLWCGPLCGVGQTLYLARRKGYAWRIWYREWAWFS